MTDNKYAALVERLRDGTGLPVLKALMTEAADAIEALEEEHAADVRPVVLCRDCLHYQADCGWCGWLDIGMNVNDFCSRGEKKEER